jgi:hypothetical protein
MIARLTGLGLGALVCLTGAHAQQPVTPGQIAPYVDTIYPRPSLPPEPEPLDRLYPPPLRPAPLPDRSVPAPLSPLDLARPPQGTSLPQGFTMTVQQPGPDAGDGPIARPRDVGERLAVCWTSPGDGSEATVRLAFDRRGHVLGEPRITYLKAGPGTSRTAVRESMERAIAECAPLRFTPDLGSAIAGRPFTIRFIARSGGRP